MAKTITDAPRKNMFVEYPEELTLVTDKSRLIYDPRVEVPPEESMIKNIMRFGVKEPVLVMKNGVEKEVVAGRNRVKAAIEANKRLVAEGGVRMRIPVIYQTGDEQEMFGVMVSENDGRRDDGPLSKAKKLERFLAMGRTEKEAAVVFCVNEQTIRNWVTLLGLDPVVKNAVERNEIPATAATKFAGKPPSEQKTILEALRAEGGKITVPRAAKAARGETTAPMKRMRSRKEIEAKLEMWSPETSPYGSAVNAALLWVLGDDSESYFSTHKG